MKKKLCFILGFLGFLNIGLDSQEGGWTLTPSVGLTSFVSADLDASLATTAPASAILIEYELLTNFVVGGRVGVGIAKSGDWQIPYAIYSASAGWRFTPDLCLGFEVGVLPGLSATFGPIHVALGFSPLYVFSGLPSLSQLLLGYRFRI